MLKIAINFFILGFSISYAFGQSENSGFEPNPKFPYLKFRSYLDLNVKVPPQIYIYDNPEFKGKPILSLDKKGLKINGTNLCEWSSDYSNTLDKRFLVKTGTNENCGDLGRPLISNESPGGTPLLWIELSSISSENHYEAFLNGKKLFIRKDKKNLVFHESDEKKLEIKKQQTRPEYEKLLNSDKSLVAFIERFHKCFKEKDLSCLEKSSSGEIKAFKYFQEYICTSAGLGPETRILRFCQALKDNCNENDIGSAQKKQCEDYTRSQLEFKEYFWKVYSNCLNSTDGKTLEGEVLSSSPQGISLAFYAKDFQRVTCLVGKRKKQDEFVWEFFTGL